LANVNALGFWSIGPIAQADGLYNLTAVATDRAGNTGSMCSPVAYTLDVTPPAKPTIALPTKGLLANHAISFNGMAEANSQVKLYDSGNLMATAAADSTGFWQVGALLPSNGIHNYTVTATDAATNISPVSDVTTVTIDTIAPAKPVITAPAAGLRTNHAFDVAGTAEASSTVRVYDNGGLVATTTASAGGAWSLPSGLPADGTHAYTATATDAATNTSPSSDAVSVIVDTIAPAAPVITAPVNNSAANGPVTVSGTAEAGSTVTVYNGGPGAIATVVASVTGAWTTGPLTLSDGPHALTAKAADAAANVSPVSAAANVFIDKVLPTAAIATPALSTNETATTALTVTWSGSDAAPSSGITGYDVQYKIGSTGTWVTWKSNIAATSASYTGYAGLTYYFRARARDRAANTSAWTAESPTIVPYDQGAFSQSGWTTSTPAGDATKLFMGSSMRSAIRNASATLNYTGIREVTLLITKRNDGGKMTVTAGGATFNVNCYSPTTQYRVPVTIKTYAAPTAGTIKVTVMRAKDPGSKGFFCEIDGVALKR
jgi:hypothetical protein